MSARKQRTNTTANPAPRESVPGATVGARSYLRALAAWALVFAALLVLYAPALTGQYLWDDHENITSPELRTWQGLQEIWFHWGATQTYYPVLHTLYWVEQKLWGDATLGYHVASIFFHSVSVCLVYWIVRRLKIPGALLAAAVFTVHPVYVESIAWVTEQKNTLSGMFTLASLLAYLHFDDSRRRGTYTLALVLFLLALESKATAVTLPVALLVVLWWKRGALSWWRDLAPLVPWFALSALIGAFTVWYERVYVGVQGKQFLLTPLQRCLLASRAIWFYLAKLFWPAELTFIYTRWEINSAEAWQYFYPAGVAALLAGAWAVHRRWRAPWAALLFFLGTLFPLLGFFPTYIFSYTYVCDHFQYLPSLGIVVLVAAGIALLLNRLSGALRHIGQGLCVLLLAVLAWLSWQQTKMYGDVVSLYQTTIARNPTCWMAHNNLGLELVSQGDQQAAIEHYQQALAIRPDYPEAHNNLGLLLSSAGRLPEAIDHFQQALAHNFNYLDAHVNLGIALAKSGKTQEAISQFQDAVQLNPNYAIAHNDLGNALFAAGRTNEAITHYRRSLQLAPDYAEAQLNFANTLRESGRFEEAIEHYLQALRLMPNDTATYAILTKTYAALQRPTEAMSTAQKALDLARAQGQTELAQQIEAWLTKYRSEQANP